MSQLPDSPHMYAQCFPYHGKGFPRFRSIIKWLNTETHRYCDLYVATRETKEEALAVAEEFIRTGIRPPKIKPTNRLNEARKRNADAKRAARLAAGLPKREDYYVKAADFIGPRLPRKTVDSRGRRINRQTEPKHVVAPPVVPDRIAMMKMVLARVG